jgi:Skp family chaperone for outer membrane proteins
MRGYVLVAVVLLAAACSSSAQRARPPSVAAGDAQACAQLFARLQRVSAAIQGSSELIASSVDKTQLSERIAYEQSQLQQAADLMEQGPIPDALRAADRDLVDALRAFTADFERAREPAARGDFRAAAAAMTDQGAVQRIVAAAKTIEDACK